MFPLAAHPFRSAADWENLRVPVSPYGATSNVLMPVPRQADWSSDPSNLKGPLYQDFLSVYIIVRFQEKLEFFRQTTTSVTGFFRSLQSNHCIFCLAIIASFSVEKQLNPQWDAISIRFSEVTDLRSIYIWCGHGSLEARLHIRSFSPNP